MSIEGEKIDERVRCGSRLLCSNRHKRKIAHGSSVHTDDDTGARHQLNLRVKVTSGTQVIAGDKDNDNRSVYHFRNRIRTRITL